MGYYFELRAPAGMSLTSDEVEIRLRTAGLEPHPDYDREFLVGRGCIGVNSPEKVASGIWAWIRLSFAHEKEDLRFLMNVAAEIGALLYDEQIDEYVTEQNADRIVTTAHGIAHDLLGWTPDWRSDSDADDPEADKTERPARH